MKRKVAILVDGEFYIKMYCQFFKVKTQELDYKKLAKALQIHCMKHIDKDSEILYRIYFYDCKPLMKKCHNPISKKSVDLSESPVAELRNNLHKEIITLPCFALRFGYLDEKNAKWQINNDKYDDLLKGKIKFNDIGANDLHYKAKQKGIDMKIGLDVAHLSYKKLVDKIVLISGDSDFVPAAKLARKEGLHFTLDPMHMKIREDLAEHIDYLKTTLPRKILV